MNRYYCITEQNGGEIVEAMQFGPSSADDIADFLGMRWKYGWMSGRSRALADARPDCIKFGPDMSVCLSDWCIKHQNGGIGGGISADLFDSMYRPVASAPS